MTIQVAPTRQLTDAVVAGLRATIGDGIQVFDTVTYGTVRYPYLVVHVISGALSGPPLLGGEDDLTQTLQLDAVGKRRDQSQGLADRARQRILTVGLTVAGWTCARRETETLGQALAEGQPERELFTVAARYGLTWTPSA